MENDVTASVARAIAGRWRPVGILDLDDFAAVAELAHWQAVRDYDPECGAPLRSVVARRVQVALLRAHRDQTGVSEYGRLHGVQPPQIVPYDEREHGGVCAGVEDAVVLKCALSSLPARMRSVVWLRCCGYTHGEIARALGVSSQTVSSDYYEGVYRLRRYMA